MKKTMTVLCVLALMGCSTGTVNTAGPKNTTANEIEIKDKRVTTDKKLSGDVRLIGLNESVTPDGLRKVQAEFLNRRDEVHRFQYQWEWFDENGMRINTPLSRWRYETIAGKETKYLQGTAPTPSAKDFTLKIIRPEN